MTQCGSTTAFPRVVPVRKAFHVSGHTSWNIVTLGLLVAIFPLCREGLSSLGGKVDIKRQVDVGGGQRASERIKTKGLLGSRDPPFLPRLSLAHHLHPHLFLPLS